MLSVLEKGRQRWILSAVLHLLKRCYYTEPVASQRGTDEGQEATATGSSMRGKKASQCEWLSTGAGCTYRQSVSLGTVTIRLDKTLSIPI